MLAAFGRKLQTHTPLDSADFRHLLKHLGHPRVYPARVELDFRHDGSNRGRAFLIDEGWALTYKLLPDGSRQVIDIGIAGDIIGMRALLLRHNDLLATTTTSVILYEIERTVLENLYRDAPKVAAAILWGTSLEESLVVERLVDIGRRSAVERLAHFILELRHRLQLVGLDDGNLRFRCPLSQTVLADALGLTPIHLNRTIRQLRVMGAMRVHDGVVDIVDEAKLIDVAGYEPLYLDAIAPVTRNTLRKVEDHYVE